VLVLVPESSYLEDILPRLGLLAGPQERSLLRQGPDRQEYGRWLKVRQGEVKLAVGFLSAVFAPVQSLGLIVIIDEESRFYKNDQTPFYHAREAAFLRAEMEGASVVCVSSAPSVELWREVAQERLACECLDAPLPSVRFLDISNFKMKRGSLLSPGLRLHLEGVLKAGGKALLYVPASKGVGFVLEEIKKYMPQARAAGYEKSSSALPEADIIVATQAVFRYRGRVMFDFAAALDIDFEFHKADHRAAHSAFALVQYLRQMARKSVLLQTREPKSPQLHAIADDSHEKFYAGELKAREEMGFPPFGVFVALVVRSADPELACREAKRLYDVLNATGLEGMNVMEPQQDRTAMARGKFRWRVMLQGQSRQPLVKTARDAALKFRGKKDTILTVNIDP
jgi:primosomal protein N'